MQVGTTEDQGLYNKPSAAGHRGALADGTLPQYNRSAFPSRNTSVVYMMVVYRFVYDCNLDGH